MGVKLSARLKYLILITATPQNWVRRSSMVSKLPNFAAGTDSGYTRISVRTQKREYLILITATPQKSRRRSCMARLVPLAIVAAGTESGRASLLAVSELVGHKDDFCLTHYICLFPQALLHFNKTRLDLNCILRM